MAESLTKAVSNNNCIQISDCFIMFSIWSASFFTERKFTLVNGYVSNTVYTVLLNPPKKSPFDQHQPRLSLSIHKLVFGYKYQGSMSLSSTW